MTEKELKKYCEEDREEELAIERRSEERVLAPIAEALGIDGDRLERVKATPCQIAVACIACIEGIKSKLETAEAKNAELQKTLDAIDEGNAFFKNIAERIGMWTTMEG